MLQDHPKRGALVPAAQQAVDALQAFVTSKGLVSLPSTEPVIVAAAPPYDLGLASMHSSPPLEATPVKSYFYITDAQADWDAARQDAWLQKFNIPTLTVITSHEVMPGHYVHSLFMRKTPGKIRRIWIGLNPFPQPSSGQDGWAHYAEQLVLDEGFKADDPRYRMAQLSEAMTRICRLIAGIQLHTGAWTVDQAAQLFERRAHLPPPAARQEAERGTYDPTYGGYFLGKLQALKLRDDVRAKEGRVVRPAPLPRAGDDQRHRAVVGAPPVAAARRHRRRCCSRRASSRLEAALQSCPEAELKLCPSTIRERSYEKPIQRPAAATTNHSRSDDAPVSRSATRLMPSTPITRCRTAKVNASATGKVVIFTQNAWL